MFWHKKNILKKGYILIYTLIIGLCILMIAVFSFTLEVKRKMNLQLYEKNLEVKQYSRETKECLLSEMNNFVCSKVTVKDRISVQQMFLNLKEDIKIGNDDYYICYKAALDKFLIFSISLDGRKKYDYYKYDFVNGKLNYTASNS